MSKTVNIRGNVFEIDLEKRILIDADNPKKVERIEDDQIDHFRQIANSPTLV